MRRTSEILLPWLRKIGQTQVGHTETTQAGLGFGTGTGGTFIANFTATAGGCAGKWRNCSRVIMRFNFHQNMHGLGDIPVFVVLRLREKPAGHTALHHGGVILVCRQHTSRRFLMCITYHGKQRMRLINTVYRPARIKDLVAAMLGICLRKHHQFNIVRITAQTRKGITKIVNFILSQCQTHSTVGLDQCLPAKGQHFDLLHRGRAGV